MQVSKDVLASDMLSHINFMDLMNLIQLNKYLKNIYDTEDVWRTMLARDFQIISQGKDIKKKYIDEVNNLIHEIFVRGSDHYLETEFPNTSGEIDIFKFPITLGSPIQYTTREGLLTKKFTIRPDVWIGETGLYSNPFTEEEEIMCYLVKKEQGDPNQVVKNGDAKKITLEEAKDTVKKYKNEGYLAIASPFILEDDISKLIKFGLIA